MENKLNLIFDAHQDLAWNMHVYNRDYTLSVKQTRESESGSYVPDQNGDTLLGWPEYQNGRIALVIGSLFALPLREKHEIPEKFCYEDSSQAYQLYSRQCDQYHRLVNDHPDMFQLIETKDNLDALVAKWKNRDEDSQGEQGAPTGIIISIEGAECVRDPGDLAEWHQRGVRLIGPAWAGNRYCGGTNEPGPLTPEGFDLLEAMADFGFILDLSHMDEQAALQALDFYPGQIVATHSNAAGLLNNYEGNRHLSDHMIKKIIERDGVIGVIPFNKFLLNGWKIQDGRDIVTLEHFTAHIDYICQFASSSKHAAIGSDFDGGFGLQSVPSGIDSVADLQKITPILVEKGYTDSDIGAVLANNWYRTIYRSLPDGK